jgi:hypothetical protein
MLSIAFLFKDVPTHDFVSHFKEIIGNSNKSKTLEIFKGNFLVALDV